MGKGIGNVGLTRKVEASVIGRGFTVTGLRNPCGLLLPLPYKRLFVKFCQFLYDSWEFLVEV